MILAHVETLLPITQSNNYVGSPMYGVIPEHEAAAAMVLILVGGAWFMRRRAARGSSWAVSWVGGYRRLPKVHRLLAWLLAISATVHLGLVFGHEPSTYSVLYAIGALTLTWVLFRLVRGRPWKRWTRLVLLGSIFGYAVSTLGGEPPDQLGMATKLVELTALAIAMTPEPGRRARQVLANTGLIVLFLVISFSAWVGAFTSGGGHHLGDVPAPGVLLPAGEDREPTAAEVLAADQFYEATVAALTPFADPAIAAAAGYDVDGMWGHSFHAANAAYESDGHIFDPDRPETLVYAMVDGEPVLLGAQFSMPEKGLAGPAIGGPLTVWHAHDHVCVGLPGVLTGLQSPFGTCPIGSISIPETNEMIHVWTLPGVPEPFGDLDDAWLNEYLEAA